MIWISKWSPPTCQRGSFVIKKKTNPSAASQVLVAVQVLELELELEEEVHFVSSTYTFMIKNAVD